MFHPVLVYLPAQVFLFTRREMKYPEVINKDLVNRNNESCTQNTDYFSRFTRNLVRRGCLSFLRDSYERDRMDVNEYTRQIIDEET